VKLDSLKKDIIEIILRSDSPLEDDVTFIKIDEKIRYKVIPKKYLVKDKLLDIIISLNYTPEVILNTKNIIMVKYIEGNQISWDEFYKDHLDNFMYLSNELFNNSGITYSEISMYNFIKKDKLYWIDYDSFQCDKSFIIESEETWREIARRKHLINGNFRQSLINNKNFLKYNPLAYIKFSKYKD
jgi:predicted Ser/Thr protein kinase